MKDTQTHSQPVFDGPKFMRSFFRFAPGRKEVELDVMLRQARGVSAFVGWGKLHPSLDSLDRLTHQQRRGAECRAQIVRGFMQAEPARQRRFVSFLLSRTPAEELQPCAR